MEKVLEKLRPESPEIPESYRRLLEPDRPLPEPGRFFAARPNYLWAWFGAGIAIVVLVANFIYFRDLLLENWRAGTLGNEYFLANFLPSVLIALFGLFCAYLIVKGFRIRAAARAGRYRRGVFLLPGCLMIHKGRVALFPRKMIQGFFLHTKTATTENMQTSVYRNLALRYRAASGELQTLMLPNLESSAGESYHGSILPLLKGWLLTGKPQEAEPSPASAAAPPIGPDFDASGQSLGEAPLYDDKGLYLGDLGPGVNLKLLDRRVRRNEHELDLLRVRLLAPVPEHIVDEEVWIPVEDSSFRTRFDMQALLIN